MLPPSFWILMSLQHLKDGSDGGLRIGKDAVDTNRNPTYFSGLATLYDRTGFLCVATLISARWAITSATCVTWCCEPYMVVGYQADSSIGSLQKRSVQRFITHPNYSIGQEGYSVALVQASGPFELNKDVRPVPVQTRDRGLLGTACVMHGVYYTTEMRSMEVVRVSEVHASNLSMFIQGPYACRESSNFWLRDDLICAGYSGGYLIFCMVSNGGPLVCEGELVAIQTTESNGPNCWTYYRRYGPFVSSFSVSSFINEYVFPDRIKNNTT